MLAKVIRFFLENKLVTILILLICIVWGIATAPFNWKMGIFPRSPVPVDAIPDIGENQQIVYTEWPGRSPQDIEDQITYPLTTALLGISGVKTVRSSSIFGLSSIYIIFDDKVDFYWSRTRILEKLNSLPSELLPEGVSPALGPDATALGQIYWYTLEGRDEKGRPAGGWDPQELRTIQDYYVRYALSSAKDISEVASIGGFVREYQIDINPDAMKAYHVNVGQIMEAVRKSKLIEKHTVTDASVRGSTPVTDIMEEKDADQELYGDSAYTGPTVEAAISKNKMKNCTHDKGYRNKPLTEEQKKQWKKVFRESADRAYIWICGKQYAWFIYSLYRQDTGGVTERVNEFDIQFISVYSTAKDRLRGISMSERE